MLISKYDVSMRTEQKFTVVPQLDKYLKFMAFPLGRGYFVSSRVMLCPRIDLNFRHLSSKLWHYMYRIFMMCKELFILQELLRSKTCFE